MIYNYINNLDKQVNETITLYKNLAKLSKPMIQYIIFIISLLIFTCCFLILFYCINSNLTTINTTNNNIDNIKNIKYNHDQNHDQNHNHNELFINVILPIMLYGLLCPILSTIIGSICKIFFESLIQKIRTQHLYIKHIIKDNNIINYILFHKINIIYPLLYLFIYNFNDFVIYTYILIYLCIQFNRIFIFYTNSIDCKIISIEKCYNNNDNYWNFELEINTNHETKTVNKRFNDFKKLASNYNYNNIKLPTSSWLFKPNNITDATTRAIELNKYIKKITNDDSLLQNSVFFNFINSTNEVNSSNNINNNINNNKNNNRNNNTNNITNIDSIANVNNIILEKDFIKNENIDNDYGKIFNNIENIKKQCSLLINHPIRHIFILNEINYYNNLKKRIIILTDLCIFKIKYYITLNTFEVRNIIEFNSIDSVIFSTINNTSMFYKKKILIIKYNNIDLKLISLSDSYFYNINKLYKILKEYNINIIYNDSISIDNGFGISEIILNSSVIDVFKNSYYKSITTFT